MTIRNGAEKVLPHHYDLHRLEEVLKEKENTLCVFQPIDSTNITVNGICSGFRGVGKNKKYIAKLPLATDLRNGIAKTPASLAERITFLPRLRLKLAGDPQGLLESKARVRLVEELVRLNSTISKDFFVLPQLFDLNGKTLGCWQMLMSSFQSHVSKEYPGAKIGFELSAGQHKLVQTLAPGCDFVALNSGVRSSEGKINLWKAISEARANDLEVYCLNASLFAGNKVFAACLVSEPIEGFSFRHGGRPHEKTKYYYHPKAIVHSDEKSNHYWTEAEIRQHYEGDMLLSDICPCAECGRFSVNEWFARDFGQISQSNLRHKSLLLSVQATKEWQRYLKKIAQIEPTIEKQLSNAAVTAARVRGKSEKHDGPKAISTLKAQAIETRILALIRQKRSDVAAIQNALYGLTPHRIRKAILSLLRSGEIKHHKRKTDGMFFFTA